LEERNNHGHVVIASLTEMGDITLLAGLDQAPGWHTNSKSKAEMYSTTADCFRDRYTILHNEDTYYQLCGVVGSTLKAPENEHDDLAVCYALALQALTATPVGTFAYFYVGRMSRAQDRRMAAIGVTAG